MNDTTQLPPLPDRLSIDPRSKFHVAAVFEHDVGIKFNGKERNDVDEYCISEGWIKVAAGKVLDGPAPRSLDALPIRVSGSGEVEIIDMEFKAGTKTQIRII